MRKSRHFSPKLENARCNTVSLQCNGGNWSDGACDMWRDRKLQISRSSSTVMSTAPGPLTEWPGFQVQSRPKTPNHTSKLFISNPLSSIPSWWFWHSWLILLDLFDGMMMVGFARQCDGVDGVETSRVTTQLSPSSPGAIPSRIPHLFIPQTCRANAFLTGKILFPLPSHRRVVLRCMFILCPQDVEQSALPSCGFKSKYIYVKSFRTNKR